MQTFRSSFSYGDRVFIDGDDSLTGTVTAFCFRNPGYETVEVSWLANGDAKVAWFEY